MGGGHAHGRSPGVRGAGLGVAIGPNSGQELADPRGRKSIPDTGVPHKTRDGRAAARRPARPLPARVSGSVSSSAEMSGIGG